MGACGALGAIASGIVKAELGFHMLANAATVAAAVLLAAALGARRQVARAA
jgi:hypothetical protein